MDNRVDEEVNGDFVATLVADVVAAYVSNNTIRAAEISGLIAEVHGAFAQIGNAAAHPSASSEKPKPAVNPKKSIFNDYIICLEDGKKFKSLKRHLMTHYDLTPEQYREKWNLDASYPMVAPHYAQERSRLAKQIGLGHKRTKQHNKTLDQK